VPRAVSNATGLRGARVGHAEAPDGSSGVSAVVFGLAAPTVVDVRGGASGTYDTASLSLEATFGRRWAIFFSGGSLFGLDAGGGVRDEVLRGGGGHSVFHNPTRIAPVSGAVLYDLPDAPRPPVDYRALGVAAVRAARPVSEMAGRVGAGAGAKIGKYLGRGRSQPGALAVAVEKEPRLGSVAALAVLNSVGAVRDPTSGRWIAGARDSRGILVPPGLHAPSPLTGTTLVAIVTDLAVPRSVLQRVAAFAHAGLARAVVPAHTATDGDTVFVSSVAPGEPSPRRISRPGELEDRLGLLAERATVRAIVNAAGAANRPVGPPGGGARSRGDHGSSRSS
jgi:L-aminopeptidase/D-esterase-like protein